MISKQQPHRGATVNSMNSDIYEKLKKLGQAELDAAGLGDVTLTIGYYKHGDHLRQEARLTGPLESQKKARKLLGLLDVE